MNFTIETVDKSDGFVTANNILQIVVACVALIGFMIATINSILIIYRMFLPSFYNLPSYNIEKLATFFEFEDLGKYMKEIDLHRLILNRSCSDLEILKHFGAKLKNLLEKLKKPEEKPENIAAIRSIKFKCRYDPSRFTILSLFPYKFDFLVVICEGDKDANKYAYYFDYSYGKPKLLPVGKKGSLFTEVSDTIARKIMVIEKMDEEDAFIHDRLRNYINNGSPNEQLKIGYRLFQIGVIFYALRNSSFKNHVNGNIIKLVKAFYMVLSDKYYKLDDNLIQRSNELQFLISILRNEMSVNNGENRVTPMDQI